MNLSLRRELIEPAGRLAGQRTKNEISRASWEYRAASAGFIILELTETADRPAVARPKLQFFEHTQPANFIIKALLI